MTTEAASGVPRDLPRRVGPYRLVREQAHDRLGLVVGARHVPTGLPVSLTVLKGEWACLPGYVARLAREACAATAVDHPNLVRLLDVGEAQGRFYFATAPVEGTTLADRAAQGPLPAREALVHLLQAARGLRYAHAHGLTHGDITAARLVACDDGLTRVAGLGLTATPESIAAEVAREATGPLPLGPRPENAGQLEAVRADVRGLGATLVHLITGRPFTATPRESEPGPLVARGVPSNLIELVRRLLDAQPGTGITDCDQLVNVLESVLTGKRPGALSPGEEQTRLLADTVSAYRAAPTARPRSLIVLAGVAACAALTLLCLLVGLPRLGFSVLWLGLTTALANFLVRGWHGESDVFPDVRALVLESRVGDWAMGAAGLFVGAAALVVLHLHWAWLIIAGLGFTIALAVRWFLDEKVTFERREAVEAGRGIVVALRTQGVTEESVRAFVRNAALPDWESFFERLFGYRASVAAREASERGLRGFVTHAHERGRDVFMPWVDAVRAARRAERETEVFRSIEVRALVASGVNLLTARRKARRTAEAMVAVATDARAAALRPHFEASTPAGEPLMAAAVRKAAEAPEDALAERESGLLGRGRPLLVEALTGARTRFLLGAAVLAGFLGWVHQNEIVSAVQLRDVAAQAIQSDDALETLRNARVDVHLPEGETRPLDASFLPRSISGLFRGFGPAAAGLILVFSAFLRGGPIAGALAIAGALVALIGPSVGLPSWGPHTADRVGMVAGVLVASVGLLWREN